MYSKILCLFWFYNKIIIYDKLNNKTLISFEQLLLVEIHQLYLKLFLHNQVNNILQFLQGNYLNYILIYHLFISSIIGINLAHASSSFNCSIVCNAPLCTKLLRACTSLGKHALN